MNCPTVTRTATINNPKGLHLRPAGLLVQLASQFESEIELSKDGLTVDARSVLDVLTLAASNGSQLAVVARGQDAQQAADTLVEFLETDATEEEE